MMRALILAFALLLCAACARVPSLDEAQAREVIQAARELMDSDGYISADRWPAAIRKLEPNSVRVNEKGVYISTYSFYVEDAGLFVLRDSSTFVPVVRSDPSYEPMHPPLFSYFVKG